VFATCIALPPRARQRRLRARRKSSVSMPTASLTIGRGTARCPFGRSTPSVPSLSRMAARMLSACVGSRAISGISTGGVAARRGAAWRGFDAGSADGAGGSSNPPAMISAADAAIDRTCLRCMRAGVPCRLRQDVDVDGWLPVLPTSRRIGLLAAVSSSLRSSLFVYNCRSRAPGALVTWGCRIPRSGLRDARPSRSASLPPKVFVPFSGFC
jgi:hypothetical protein